MIQTIAEIIIAVLLVGGGLFGLIGSWGLLRLKDPLQRLHAPTKSTTIGVGTTLISAALKLFLATGHIAAEVLLISGFLFVTAPLSALMLARVVLARQGHPKTVHGVSQAQTIHWAAEAER